MSSSEDYMGSTDFERFNWLNNFANVVGVNYNTYQISEADGTTIIDAAALYAAKYAIAVAPSTRTTETVQEKDEARNSATSICRLFAQQIKLNAGVSDAAKIAAGIPVINETRNPRNVPNSSPLLNCLGATPGVHTVIYSDSTTPDSKAKPIGADNIQIFIAIADAATTNETDAQFYGAFTKNPVIAAFTAAQDGKMATYFARWAGKDGEVGPWSLPVSMRIAA